MRAALIKSFDGPSSIAVETVDEPVAGEGEVVIAVKAAALNFFDVLMTRNMYQFKPPLPFSPCAEVAGVVDSIGQGVSSVAPGQRVLAFMGWNGAREKVAVPALNTIALPDNVSFEVGAGMSVTYGTGMHGLRDRGQLAAGETLAVLGASGGAGLAAVELGKRLGARVIACASSAEKLDICRKHGADEGINYADEDLKQRLRDLTGGKGVDVVYDCVGGPYAEPALRSTAWGGRFLVIGFASGDIPKIPANLLLLKGSSLVGVFWGESLKRNPAAHKRNIEQVLNWVSTGDLVPHVGATYPLDRIGEALEAFEKRQVTGKAVVVI